jgi:copper chaperone NosL
MKTQFFHSRFLIASLLLPYFIYACNPSAEPIRYGRDECAFCKMTIIDERFGAEILTVKGKTFKFDDIICMIKFIDREVIPAKQIARKLISNYEKKSEFLDAENIFYYVSDDLHSPMNGNAAAFSSKQLAEAYQNGKPGQVMTWGDVYQKLK